MTLTPHDANILTTPKDQWWRHFDAPATSGEDTLMTPATTQDYLATTPHDVTDNPCDNIDDLEQITCLCISMIETKWQQEQQGDNKND